MPMNPNFLCCIGAELKNSTQQTTRMSQVYLYRAFEDDTLSDMLSAGFFNAAMGIIRKDDLLLLYSPNETTAKYTYARVSNVSSSGVVIEQIGIDATQIIVDTTGFSNLSGNNLQEILNNLDTTITTINNAFVRKDGSSVMTGPLKFRAGSFVGAIAGGLGDGISFYKLKGDNTIDSEVASLTKENGFTPGTTNAQDIGSSSLKWKDLYVARVIASVLNNGANINIPTTGGTLGLNDFSNITDSAKNISNWSSNVSNCLIEIPQDINLELNNGTLTLKAGSKITSPDGTQVTITVDRTGTMTAAGQYFVFANKNNGVLQLGTSNAVSLCGSGPSLPADGNTYKVFFNTTDSKIYRWDSSAWVEWSVAFPLAIITVSSGAISSIDEVFNGFGYIGSTVFVLPGVKGLIPNGRNADGSLKNNTMTVQNVLTRTIPSNTDWHYLSISASGTSCDFRTNYFQGASNPSSAPQFSVFYNYDTNLSYLQATVGAWTQQNNFVCPFRIEHESSSPYKIISIQPANVFHAVDYNDTEFIAHQAKPSDRYVDLTLPADGNSITVPADGILYLSKNSDATGQRVRFWNRTTSASISTWSSGVQNLEIIMSVSKGDTITVVYNAGGTTNAFKFIYANGAK